MHCAARSRKARAAFARLLADPQVDGGTRDWLLTSVAELEERAGRPAAAEAAYKAALAAAARRLHADRLCRLPDRAAPRARRAGAARPRAAQRRGAAAAGRGRRPRRRADCRHRRRRDARAHRPGQPAAAGEDAACPRAVDVRAVGRPRSEARARARPAERRAAARAGRPAGARAGGACRRAGRARRSRSPRRRSSSARSVCTTGASMRCCLTARPKRDARRRAPAPVGGGSSSSPCSLAALPLTARRTRRATPTCSCARRRRAGIELRWDIALRDLDAAIDLDADGDGRLTWREVRTAWPAIDAYALPRLQPRRLPAAGRPTRAGAAQRRRLRGAVARIAVRAAGRAGDRATRCSPRSIRRTAAS